MEFLQTLNAEGHRMFRFGGDQAHRVKQVGDFMVSHEWFGPTNKTIDACVVIWPASEGLDGGAWLISRKRIVEYCDQHNRPTPYAFDEAHHALIAMGRFPLGMEVRKLVGLLMDQVDDLIQMPVAPVAVKRRLVGDAIWEVTTRNRDTGKTLREVSI